MKKLFLVGNWKSNKTMSEAHLFMTRFLNREFISWLHTVDKQIETKKRIVICPPFTLLYDMAHLLERHDIKMYLGAQNVSAFDEGAHTSEESARGIAEFAQYVIIGHSESRKELAETDEILSETS